MGVGGQRWEAWRRQERKAVADRARGRCGVPGCLGRGVDVHHPYGRSPEPWASSRLVSPLLCRAHHEVVTGRVGSGLDGDLRDLLRGQALEAVRAYVGEALARAGRPLLMPTQEGQRAQFDWVRRVAEIYGIWPPGWPAGRHAEEKR